MAEAVFDIAHLLLTVITWIIIIQFVISLLFMFNALNAQSSGVRSFAEALDRLTEPLFRPIRKILPDFGAIDLSPLVVLILIRIGHMLLDGAERSLLTGA